MSASDRTGQAAGTGMQILTFGLQGEIFALEARHVREILDLVPVTEVPGAPAFLNGLVNVRGKIVPLSDLRLKLGMQPGPATIDSRLVVVEIEVDGEPTVVGLRADKVFEMAEIAADMLTDTPPIGMRWRPELVRCIAKRGGDFIIVFDLEAFFTAPRSREIPTAVGRPTTLAAVS